MTTATTVTLGNAPSDYATFAAWKAAQTAAALNLVTSDTQITFVMKAQIHAPIDTGTGFTADATRYLRFIASDANVVANPPLRYDSTRGSSIETSADYVNTFVTKVPYTRVEGLQIGSFGTSVHALAAFNLDAGSDGSVASRCLITGYCQDVADGLAFVARLYGASTIADSLVVSRSTDPAASIVQMAYGAKAINTGFVSLNTKLSAGIKTAGVAAKLYNCHVMNVTAPEDGSVVATKANCFTDATAAGWTTAPYSTATFVSIDPTGGTSHDLRLAAGSALIGAGVVVAGGTTSLDNATLSVGASCNVGPWQAAAGQTGTGTNNNPPVVTNAAGTPTGSTTATISVSVDQAGGTLYYLTDGNQPNPTSAAIKAGKSYAVSVTGSQSINLTGLAPDTLLYAHFVYTNSSALDSSIISSSGFRTQAVDNIAPQFPNGAVIMAGAVTASSLAFTYPAATDTAPGTVAFYESSLDGVTWRNDGTGLSSSYSSGLAAYTAYTALARPVDSAGNRGGALVLSMKTAAAAPATSSFKTAPLANNATSPWGVGTVLTWQWQQQPIGTPGATIWCGTAALASDRTITATNLPAGAGSITVIRGATDAFYQPGTAA